MKYNLHIQVCMTAETNEGNYRGNITFNQTKSVECNSIDHAAQILSRCGHAVDDAITLEYSDGKTVRPVRQTDTERAGGNDVGSRTCEHGFAEGECNVPFCRHTATLPTLRSGGQPK